MSKENSLKIYTKLEDNIFSNKDVSMADIVEIISLTLSVGLNTTPKYENSNYGDNNHPFEFKGLK